MRRYLYNISSSWSYYIVSVVISFFIVPFTLKHLSNDEFAIFQIAYDVIMWFSLFNIGFGATLNNQLTFHINDRFRVEGLLSTFLLVNVALGLLGLAIGVYIGFNVVIDTSNQFDFRNAMIILSFSFLMTMLTKVYSSALYANKESYRDYSFKIIVSLLRNIVLVVLLLTGYKILALAISMLIGEVITFFGLYVLSRRYMKARGIHISLYKFSNKEVYRAFNLGKWFFVSSLATILIFKMDRLLTGIVLDLETVAVLIISSKLYDILYRMLQQLNTLSRPYLIHNKGADNAYWNYKSLTKITMGLAISIGVGIFVINESFVSFWVGKEYFVGRQVNFLLLCVVILSSWVMSHKVTLSANLWVKQQSVTRLIEGGTNLVLSIYLASYFALPGIILATCLSGMISVIAFPWIISNTLVKEKKEIFITNNYNLILYLIISIVVGLIFSIILGNSTELLVIIMNVLCTIILLLSVFVILYFKDLKDLGKLTINQLRP